MFAATPPLFAMKTLISDVATNVRKDDPKCLMAIDVSAAFLYGKTKRDLYIELPKRDPRSGNKRWVAKLLKAMYGTRDAPQVWYGEVKKVMAALGFTQSVLNPCSYFHSDRLIRVLVHVDDFLCSGTEENLQWLKDEIGNI